MSDLIKIESLTQLHEMMDQEKPRHPLVTVVDFSKVKAPQIKDGTRMTSNFYWISMKQGSQCEIRYGREYYDFQEGSLIFMAPGQIVSVVGETDHTAATGWGLFFHPDLIRRYPLWKQMNDYSFFSYDVHEALHISDKEKGITTGIVHAIEDEFSQNIDDFSQDLIVSHIELLLNYCKRFYSRQFITRAKVNKDVVSRFEEYLTEYFDSDKPETAGLPSVKQCAFEMGYSPNYLSDLLKKETGKNAQEHIHFHLIDRAKTLLVNSELSVNRIALSLGFEYPQHFSKLFKQKTGMSPGEYRN